MSTSVIRAEAGIATLVNVFTVAPETQQALVELWKASHRRCHTAFA